MSEDEIAEIVGIADDAVDRSNERKKELSELYEILHLESQAQKGTLDAEGEERLRTMRGVVYTFRCRGQQILVNHCLIAKLVMGIFVLAAVISIIYISAFVEPLSKTNKH